MLHGGVRRKLNIDWYSDRSMLSMLNSLHRVSLFSESCRLCTVLGCNFIPGRNNIPGAVFPKDVQLGVFIFFPFFVVPLRVSQIFFKKRRRRRGKGDLFIGESLSSVGRALKRR